LKAIISAIVATSQCEESAYMNDCSRQLTNHMATTIGILLWNPDFDRIAFSLVHHYFLVPNIHGLQVKAKRYNEL
jgi:hypothetical protein